MSQNVLTTEYRNRFTGLEAYREQVWQVLTGSFFNRFIRSSDTVLDLGAGWGEFIRNVNCGKKFAMDLNPDTDTRVGEGVKVILQDCSDEWLLQDNSFDVVFTSNFFEHLPNKAALERTLVERDNGRIESLKHSEFQKLVAPTQSSVAATSPDRRGAEWVLSVGGSVSVATEINTYPRLSVNAGDQLPDEPFFLTSVNITDRPEVTDEGLTNLRGCSQLGSISAYSTAITDQGLANLTDEGRQPLRNLTGLNIARTAVTEPGLRYLAGSKALSRLEIESTQVSDGSLLRNFLQLSLVNIGRTKIPAEDLSVLRELPLLRSLVVDGEQFQGVGSRHVSSLNKLTRLIVFGLESRFDNAVLNDLEELTMFQLNDLAENQLDKLLWSAVAGLPKLDHLALSGEGITDESIGKMPAMDKLQILTLGNSRNTKLSGKTIAAAVARLPDLENLSVTVKALSDADAKHFESLTQLTQLSVTGNPEITVAGIESLHKALPNCLIFSDHGTFEPIAAAMNPDRRAAEWVLNLGGMVDIQPRDGLFAMYLKEIPDGPFQLVGVHLNGSAATNEGLIHLRGLSHLRSLGIWDTQITDRGLAILTDSGRVPLSSLDDLAAQRVQISDDGIGYLAGSSQLDRLHLDGTQVADLDWICRSFPRLWDVDIGQTRITASSLVHLEKLPQLTHLGISGSQLRDGGNTYVAKLTGLKYLEVSNASEGFDSDVLQNLSSLEHLTLSEPSEDQLNREFWSAVSDLPRLTNMTLYTDGGSLTSDVVDRITTMKSLRHLHLDHSEAGAASIANAVKRLPQLKELRLTFAGLDDADAKHFESLTTLTSLDLKTTRT